MAPVAAHLAVGVPLHQVGSLANRTSIGELATVAAVDPSCLGRVVWVDRFGNAITDIRRDGPTGQGLARGAHLQVGDQVVTGPYLTFGAAPAGEPFWYWGSGDCLELGLAGESAAARYGWRGGLAIHLVDP
jgi:S-adenosylmethionine hydrolase